MIHTSPPVFDVPRPPEMPDVEVLADMGVLADTEAAPHEAMPPASKARATTDARGGRGNVACLQHGGSQLRHPVRGRPTGRPGRRPVHGPGDKRRHELAPVANTLLVWTYDEGGGYYDHVAPPTAVPPTRHLPRITPKRSAATDSGFRPAWYRRSPGAITCRAWSTTTPRSSSWSRRSGIFRRSLAAMATPTTCSTVSTS